MKFRLISVVVIIISFQAQAHLTDSVRLEKEGDEYFIIHQIDQGETLFSLSRRYASSVDDIKSVNSLDINSLEIGQVIRIPYKVKEATPENVKSHTVKKGETLFSISRDYSINIQDIKNWNKLSSNELSIGQVLLLEDQVETSIENQPDRVDIKVKEEKPTYTYYVRTGESLQDIANKFRVSEDSIMQWNKLKKTKLSPGQALIFPFEPEEKDLEVITEVNEYQNTRYGSKIRSDAEGGVEKVIEEGVARKIDEDLNTKKYLALHRNLRVGTVFQVKNLMNNQRIYVRVVGKLPDTGINQNVMIRLTPISFEKLGIIDEKALVEISYFKQ